MAAQLRHAGLRPTRQRVELGRVLFAKGHRHISAEDLHAEAEAAGVRVSLATVYNALHQFTEAGLLREVAIDGTRTYFDTNVSDHHHFFVEGEGRLIDMRGGRHRRASAEPRRDRPLRRGMEDHRRWKCVRAPGARRMRVNGALQLLLELLVRIDAPEPLLLDPARRNP